MLEASTYLSHTDTVKCRNFKGSICLWALHWIETALAVMVVAAANHVTFTRKEQRVGATAAHLNDFFIQYIESLQSDRQTRSELLSIS